MASSIRRAISDILGLNPPSRPRKQTRPRPIRRSRNFKFERQILHFVNQERRKRDISPLRWNDIYYSKAQSRAREITRRFIHENLPGIAGENIMKMPVGRVAGVGLVRHKNLAVSFVRQWMKSPGHRANILRAGYTSSCVGLAKTGRYYFASQLFF